MNGVSSGPKGRSFFQPGQKALVSGHDEIIGPTGWPFELSPGDILQRMAGLSALPLRGTPTSRAFSPGWVNGWPFRPEEPEIPALLTLESETRQGWTNAILE